MHQLRFVDGERVRAVATISDLSGDDAEYQIEAGDSGTIRSSGIHPPTADDFTVEWDKYPSEYNVVDVEMLAPAED